MDAYNDCRLEALARMATEALKGQQKAEESLTLYGELSGKIEALEKRMQEMELNCASFGKTCKEVRLIYRSVEKLVRLEERGRVREKL